jgi:hypothetical protein
MIYVAAILFLTLFYLLLRMRAVWQAHEDRQDSTLKRLEEENEHLKQRVSHLEAIEAARSPFDEEGASKKDPLRS